MSLTLVSIIVVLAAVVYVVARMCDGARDRARRSVDMDIDAIMRRAKERADSLKNPQKPLTKEQTRAELNRIRDLGRGE